MADRPMRSLTRAFPCAAGDYVIAADAVRQGPAHEHVDFDPWLPANAGDAHTTVASATNEGSRFIMSRVLSRQVKSGHSAVLAALVGSVCGHALNRHVTCYWRAIRGEPDVCPVGDRQDNSLQGFTLAHTLFLYATD